MNVTPKYARYIYRDATMLLRPKTGLKDETVEITPGSPAAGRVPKGYTVPITQTSPDGNLEELLAALDTETRASLQELLAGAGEGLAGQQREPLRDLQALRRRSRASSRRSAAKSPSARTTWPTGSTTSAC